MNKTSTNPYAIPISIIIASLFIAFALYSSPRSGGDPASISDNQQSPPGIQPQATATDNIRPVSDEDHILGNPDAPIKIVEFSDLECPFCKRFHTTMKQVMTEYGADGRVAWVYRHFPLDQIHPKARKEAEATECANELGGNEKFWEYTDRLFEVTPSNNGLDLAMLPEIAEEVGLDRAQFETCLDSGVYADHIETDTQDAIASGGRGTPFSVIIAQDGTTAPVSGALPYETLQQIINSALEL